MIRGDGIGGVYRQFLIVKFDQQGVVSEYKRSKTSTWTGVQRGCTPDVCFGPNESTLLATEEERWAAKEYEAAAGLRLRRSRNVRPVCLCRR